MTLEMDESVLERFDLAAERLLEIPEEGSLPEGLFSYFKEVADYLGGVAYFGKVRSQRQLSLEEKVNCQEKLFFHLEEDHYEESFLDPAYSVKVLGDKLGTELSAMYMDMTASYTWAAWGRLDLVTLMMEQLLLMYSMATQNMLGGALDEEGAFMDLDEVIRSFYRDYTDVFVREDVENLVDPDKDHLRRIVMESDLTREDYLYDYGMWIGANELGLHKYLMSLSEEQLQSMADTYTEGYRIGFEVTGKDLSKKKTVSVEFHAGMEAVIRRAVKNFEKMGLKATIKPDALLSMQGRGNAGRGVYVTTANRQALYDHRGDKNIYYDNAYVKRRLEVLKDAYEKNKANAGAYGGPAVTEVFGEADFEPVNKKEAAKSTPKQDELAVRDRRDTAKIVNDYIHQEERSFTIIAYPLPSIGEDFEAIFEETVKLNTLDYKKYQVMQQKIIDVLDQGEQAHVVGAGENRTDITVSLHPLQDPGKQTRFENCVADVNIPVGEVFTSPVLEGTRGVLHVSKVFLGNLAYKDLTFTFEDGCVVDYNCSNFPSEEENKKLIFDNILYKHKMLPLGEFAIGTNTTAYKMGIDYQVQAKLPILIAEKTGPHFAVGDTCYSYCEDTVVYNPNGKEIVARDNAFSIKRKSDPAEAYFNCHTDITIPYNELALIEVITKDGRHLPIIRDGRFVVPGTEELNVPLEELDKESR